MSSAYGFYQSKVSDAVQMLNAVNRKSSVNVSLSSPSSSMSLVKKNKGYSKKEKIKNASKSSNSNKEYQDIKKDSVLPSSLIDNGLSKSQKRRIRKKQKKNKKQECEVQNIIKNNNVTCKRSITHLDGAEGVNAKKPRRELDFKKNLNDTSEIPLLIDCACEDCDFDLDIQNPLEIAEDMLSEMLQPVPLNIFLKNYYDKLPVHVDKSSQKKPEIWVDMNSFDEILLAERLMHNEHILLLQKSKSGFISSNVHLGRVYAPLVWDHFSCGNPVCMEQPQLYFPKFAYYLGLFQEYFGLLVESSLYLHPSMIDLFYWPTDNTDMFILQQEGLQNFRIQINNCEAAKLSHAFETLQSLKGIRSSIPIVDIQQGDVLYVPRGCECVSKVDSSDYSLCLKISFNGQTWGDYLKKLIPVVLEGSMKHDIEFSRCLPKGILQNIGSFFDSKKTEAMKCESDLRTNVVRLLKRLVSYIESEPKNKSIKSRKVNNLPDCLHVAADQMVVDFIKQSRPPVLSDAEAYRHVSLQGERWFVPKKGDNRFPGVVNVVELEPETRVRLVRWSAVRILPTHLTTISNESSPYIVYHSMNNSGFLNNVDRNYMAATEDHFKVLSVLMTKYPDYVRIDDLPLSNTDDRIKIVNEFYVMGFLMTEEFLVGDDSEDNSSCDEPSNNQSQTKSDLSIAKQSKSRAEKELIIDGKPLTKANSLIVKQSKTGPGKELTIDKSLRTQTKTNSSIAKQSKSQPKKGQKMVDKTEFGEKDDTESDNSQINDWSLAMESSDSDASDDDDAEDIDELSIDDDDYSEEESDTSSVELCVNKGSNKGAGFKKQFVFVSKKKKHSV